MLTAPIFDKVRGTEKIKIIKVVLFIKINIDGSKS